MEEPSEKTIEESTHEAAEIVQPASVLASASAELPAQVQKRNAMYVQADAVAIGMANAASPYLPVFLTRLGATSTQVGLLTTMPGITGLLFAIPAGRFLQSRDNIIPWFSTSRVLYISAYALTGLVTLFMPREYAVLAILAIWALATLPQTLLSVSFTVVMNAVSGPHGRYELMSRRWSIIGITTAITVALVGQYLDRVRFPLNYQSVFMVLSIGGALSYFITMRIVMRKTPHPAMPEGLPLKQQVQDYLALVRSQPAFMSFVLKRFVYLFGSMLALPLFPLFYVRELHASDAWIGIFSTIQTAIVLVGYTFWARRSRLHGSRQVLLLTTFGMAAYTALVAVSSRVEMVAVFSILGGIFQAGIDLVFFDELMKTVPDEYSATFVSLAQSFQHFSAVIAPLIGTFLADQISLSAALLIAACLRLGGFALFAFSKPHREAEQ